MKRIKILGNAASNIVFLMDAILDIEMDVCFDIYPNLSTIEEPNIIFDKDQYRYQIFNPGTYEHIDGEFFTLGVNGPSAKESVLDYFLKYGVNRNYYNNWIHPKAYVSRSASISTGLFIEPNATISSQASIGFGVNVKRNSSIGHHTTVNDFVEINPGVHIMSYVSIGKNTIIGGGSSIKDGVNIGSNVTIGMGSNVVKDIPDNVIAFGNPCVVWKPK